MTATGFGATGAGAAGATVAFATGMGTGAAGDAATTAAAFGSAFGAAAGAAGGALAGVLSSRKPTSNAAQLLYMSLWDNLRCPVTVRCVAVLTGRWTQLLGWVSPHRSSVPIQQLCPGHLWGLTAANVGPPRSYGNCHAKHLLHSPKAQTTHRPPPRPSECAHQVNCHTAFAWLMERDRDEVPWTAKAVCGRT